MTEFELSLGLIQAGNLYGYDRLLTIIDDALASLRK